MVIQKMYETDKEVFYNIEDYVEPEGVNYEKYILCKLDKSTNLILISIFYPDPSGERMWNITFNETIIDNFLKEIIQINDAPGFLLDDPYEISHEIEADFHNTKIVFAIIDTLEDIQKEDFAILISKEFLTKIEGEVKTERDQVVCFHITELSNLISVLKEIRDIYFKKFKMK